MRVIVPLAEWNTQWGSKRTLINFWITVTTCAEVSLDKYSAVLVSPWSEEYPDPSSAT